MHKIYRNGNFNIVGGIYTLSNFLRTLFSFFSGDTSTTRLFALYVLKDTNLSTSRDKKLIKKGLLYKLSCNSYVVEITESGSRFIEELVAGEKFELMLQVCSLTFEKFTPLLVAIEKLMTALSKEELPIFLSSDRRPIRESAIKRANFLEKGELNDGNER